MTESKPERPSQVTLAGGLVVAGSVLVVLLAFNRVATLHSLQAREAIEDYLDSSTGRSLDLTVAKAQTLIQVAAMFAAAFATTTAILGWQVLQRSKGARLALSVLAVPVFLTGFVTGRAGGYGAGIVTASIVMLWFQPARDWFAGVTRSAPVLPPLERTARPAPPSPPTTGRDPLLDLPPPTAPPLHATPYAAGSGASRTHSDRPNPVVWACAIVWASTSAVFLMFTVTLLQLVAAPDSLLEELRRQNPTSP